MRYIVILALMSGCVTGGAVRQAQSDSLTCWQAYRSNPSPGLYNYCEQEDLQARQLAASHAQQRQVWRSAQAQSTSCRSQVVGQNVYTTCD